MLIAFRNPRYPFIKMRLYAKHERLFFSMVTCVEHRILIQKG